MAIGVLEKTSRAKPIYVPNTLAQWPWPRAVNPHYEQGKRESSAWFESFQAFGPRAQRAFDKCDFSLLAGLAYPRLDQDAFRILCDTMMVFFLFDESSDRQGVDEAETRKYADIIMSALRDPHSPRPQGEWVGGEITRQFWENAVRTIRPSTQRRFIATFGAYADAVVQQSSDRDRCLVRDVQSYFGVRRLTIGARPSFALNAIPYDDLPDRVLDDAAVQRLEFLATDMIAVTNDLYSYNVEQSRGDDGHNLVTVVMNQYGFGVQQAVDWIASLHSSMQALFLAESRALPQRFRGESDAVRRDVVDYVEDVANWVRANDQWSFESQRYFGTDGLRVMKERVFTLLPKQQ